MFKRHKSKKDEEVSETGSMLLLKFESFPKLQLSRRRRNMDNFTLHMQSLSEDIDPCYFQEEEIKSTFQKVLEDQDRLDFVHKFFKLSEQDQDKVISSLQDINEEISIDNETSIVISHDYELIGHPTVKEVDGFCYVCPSKIMEPKYLIRNGLQCLSKKNIKFLQRQHELGRFEDIENQLRNNFQNNVKNKWQNDDFTPYERYITHIIAQYLGLFSESFNNRKKRVIRVSNQSCVFVPPKNFLYQEMANNIHVY